MKLKQMITWAGVTLVTLLGAGSVSGQGMPEDPREKYMNTITADQVKGHIYFLADDLLEGRETGERGQHLAGVYIRSQFMRMGLAAGNPVTGDYYQPFYLNSTEIVEGEMKVRNDEFAYKTDYVSGNGGLLPSGEPDLAFVGYGIERDGYNNLAEVDLEGKVALMVAGQPEGGDPNMSLFGQIRAWKTRGLALAEHGATGVIMVVPDSVFRVLKRYSRSNSTEIGAEPTPGTPLIYASEAMGEAMLKAGKTSLEKVRGKLDQSPDLPRVKTDRIRLVATSEMNFSSKEASNVLAFLPGSTDPDEVLVVTGHYDHVGVNSAGEIHNGADDDASGTTTVLLVAEAFARAARAGFQPRRSILFMTVSGEEKGLLGSNFYTEHPLYPLEQTVANLNVDMVGRIDPKYSEREDSTSYVYLIGSDRISTDLHRWSETMNERYTGLTLDYTYNDENDPNRYYYRSDHYNFAENGIPVIFYFNGTHADYHKPTDDADKIRLEKVAQIARLVFVTAWEVANQSHPPKADVITKD